MDTSTPRRHGAAPTLPDHVREGYDLLGQGRFADAVTFADALVEARGDDVHALVLAAEAHMAAGDGGAALAHVDRAIAASGGDPFLKLKKGRLLGLLRRRDEVPAIAAEVAAVAGDNGRLLRELAVLHQRNNRFDDAIRIFERVCALRGAPPGVFYELAVTRFFNGDFDGAERDLEAMLARAPQSGPALYLRSTLRRQSRDRNHLADLACRLKAGFTAVGDEVATLYATAKELEDVGEHRQSFAALAAGAARHRGTLRYDVATETSALEAIREAWTADAVAQPSAGHHESGAIFIVGMPRTGTTLAERLLVQSGDVVAAGELLDFGNLLGAATRRALDAAPGRTSAQASLDIDFATLGRDYMRGARQTANGSAVFIDKMPVNFMYCGMIRRALPDARIIHLVRDPLDSCYAVFKTLFFDSYSFSYDLDDLARYYIAYDATMRHWHRVMPGAILDIRYEDLVTNTAGQARRMYEWCGLPWRDDVLEVPVGATPFATASAAQVREPVHARSIGSARRHLDAMAPLVRRLVAAGIVDAP